MVNESNKTTPLTDDEKELYEDPFHYWVVETEEKEPRYIEVILSDFGERDYGFVFNINYAKVWIGKPIRVCKNLLEDRGIKAHCRKAHKRAFENYKEYEAYFSGQRELTMQEKIQLKEDIERWKEEIFPIVIND